MTPLPEHDTFLTPARDPALERLSVVDLADLLLLAVVRRKATAVVIEPSGADASALRFELGSSLTTLATLEAAHADALAARFAILSGIAVGASGQQLGRLRVRVAGSSEVELLVAVRSTPSGLIGEVRRIVGPEEQAVTPETNPVEPEEVDGVLRAIGPYRILGELGRGGMGVVYRAEHRVLEKEVAIKLLNPGLAAVPEFAARFVLEARAACRARHPGIVDVTDFGWLRSGRAYLVMELVEGETLQAALRRGPMAPPRALAIAGQVAAALDAAAARGVVHRDLKPGNVFIDRDGNAKLGDFGVATILGSDFGDGRVVGTARYMAPEQAAGAGADIRSDLYALGCVMFEMLTGRPPFDGASVTDVMVMQAQATVPAMVGPDGPLPEAIAALVRRALAKRPEERFQAPAELVAAIERARRAGGWRQWLPG